jgi:hypothetical protein
MKKLLIPILIALSTNVLAEPTGGSVLINYARPYSTGDIYIEVNSKALCGTNTFLIAREATAAKEMYQAVLTAITTSKKVRLEILNSAKCTGWGTKLQSIYLLR